MCAITVHYIAVLNMVTEISVMLALVAATSGAYITIPESPDHRANITKVDLHLSGTIVYHESIRVQNRGFYFSGSS